MAVLEKKQVLNFGFVTRCARLLTYFASMSVVASWLYVIVIITHTKSSRVNNLVREVAHAQKQNPCSDLDNSWQNVRHPRPNHLCKFW